MELKQQHFTFWLCVLKRLGSGMRAVAQVRSLLQWICHTEDVNCCHLSHRTHVLLCEKFPAVYHHFPFSPACC